MKLTLKSKQCPYCKANLVGAPIPYEHRGHYGTTTHFQRQIGIERQGDDYISRVRCPDCGAEDKVR
jgi:hypothetical protein